MARDDGSERRANAAGDSAHLARLSRVYSDETWSLYELLDRTLQPRSPDWLHELAAEYLTPGAKLLDAGCRNGAHLIRLVQANDVQGVGIEPIAIHAERARAAVATAGLEQKVTIVHGTLEDCDYPDAYFDFIWCRDVLEQIEPLVPALRQAARVLNSQGRMLVFTVVTTDGLEQGERTILNRHMGNVEANLSSQHLEAAFDEVGFVVEEKHELGTEWVEYVEERTHSVSSALLRLARLRRQRESVIASHGRDIYDHVEANLHWEVFQMLGKLEPVVYLLRHR